MTAGRIGVCFPNGYKAAGIAAGIKPAGKLDLAYVYSDRPAAAAAVFTTNVVKAASIQISQQHLHSGATKRGVIVSSGNANAATGEYGLETARAMCEAAANVSGIRIDEVLIAQTGLIGKPLDRAAACNGAAKAAAEMEITNGLLAAQSIMTTDTRSKTVECEIQVAGKPVRLGAMAKGAAMLAPSLATMLVVVTTDASADTVILNRALREAVDESFHVMVVDSCRSTNDTVFLLANGASDAPAITANETSYGLFREALTNILKDLAQQMAFDAEGASKLMIVRVTGASSRKDARMAAKGVASSTLVKCSLAGEVAYWGRVISELGASGAIFNPEEVEIFYGSHLLCKNGTSAESDEAAVSKYMKGRIIEITARIGAGPHEAMAYGCDLTHAYVDENMGKS